MENICILGVTGSIGTQALDIIRSQKEDFKLISISANRNYKKIIEIIDEFHPLYVVMIDITAYNNVNEYCKQNKLNIEVMQGLEALSTIASSEEIDIVLTSIVGMVGLKPTLAALKAGKKIALANKETLVVGGELVKNELRKNNSILLPVDSEHGAIFQCLQGNEKRCLNKILLTASGGPFRGKNTKELENVTLEQALKHPNWSMGKKITIDSATLMNKGLEVIEAHWLFDVDYENIQVVVHPQSIIHSMVEYNDGSIIAQLGDADMRLPIQYALNYPNRKNRIIKQLDFSMINQLTFEMPDMVTFKPLKLAYEAGKMGGIMPTILNSANEEAVELFLSKRISFLQIGNIIEECMLKFKNEKAVSLELILDTEKVVRKYIIEKYGL